MNIKEHVQFLILMIPTLLLLIAVVLTLAAPAGSANQPPAAEQKTADLFGQQEVVELDTDIGPMRTVLPR